MADRQEGDGRHRHHDAGARRQAGAPAPGRRRRRRSRGPGPGRGPRAARPGAWSAAPGRRGVSTNAWTRRPSHGAVAVRVAADRHHHAHEEQRRPRSRGGGTARRPGPPAPSGGHGVAGHDQPLLVQERARRADPAVHLVAAVEEPVAEAAQHLGRARRAGHRLVGLGVAEDRDAVAALDDQPGDPPQRDPEGQDADAGRRRPPPAAPSSPGRPTPPTAPTAAGRGRRGARAVAFTLPTVSDGEGEQRRPPPRRGRGANGR